MFGGLAGPPTNHRGPRDPEGNASGARRDAGLAALPRNCRGPAFQLVLTVSPTLRAFYLHVGTRIGPPPSPRRRELFPRRPQAPPPVSFQLPRDTELSCVSPLCRPRFPAAVSPRLSPPPHPHRSLPDGLLCGSAEGPTPFLCGITMAAGVSLPALAIQVTLSDAILCRSGSSRRQRVSGAEWGTDPGSRDRTVGE